MIGSIFISSTVFAYNFKVRRSTTPNLLLHFYFNFQIFLVKYQHFFLEKNT